MNDSTNSVRLECPSSSGWISFRLVDEHGSGRPFSGLSYQLLDSQRIEHTGVLDGEGYARVDQLNCGLLVLQISASYTGSDEWYARISRRDKFTLPLTALQVAAESSPSGPRRVNGETYLAEARARHEGAHFYRVEVSDFAEAKKHLPEPDERWGPRPASMLKRNLGLDEGSAGLVLPSGVSYMLEIKALRAYSPLFSREKDFCALNAYHLALMSTFAYARSAKNRRPQIYMSLRHRPTHCPVASGMCCRINWADWSNRRNSIRPAPTIYFARKCPIPSVWK